MKKSVLLLAVTAVFIAVSCKKDDNKSDRYLWLTGTIWLSDSLLVNGQDASGPDGMLADFKGEAVFRTDGTGTFGSYSGTWKFAQKETELVIYTPDLPIPLNTLIHELNAQSLKVSTSFPNLLEPTNPYRLRLTFKAKP